MLILKTSHCIHVGSLSAAHLKQQADYRMVTSYGNS